MFKACFLPAVAVHRATQKFNNTNANAHTGQTNKLILYLGK